MEFKKGKVSFNIAERIWMQVVSSFQLQKVVCLPIITFCDRWLKTQSRIQIGSGKQIVIQVLCLSDFDSDIAFLESEEGKQFLSVFTHLRLQHIISDLASARILERDSLIPSGE